MSDTNGKLAASEGASFMGRFRRWWMGYQAIAFVVLIPVISYYVITEHLPKKILLICIPCYALMAWSCYTIYKNASRPK
jgi:hypothetical protein